MAEETGEPTKVFFISPIGEEKSPEREHADTVRKYVVEKALERPKYQVERADDDTNPGNITPRIIAAIQEADLVVADLTGLNPNVFYELAVAHGYQKPVVLIFKKGERIPFDLKDVRVVRYDVTHPAELERAQQQLHASAEAAIAAPASIQTPLSAAGRFLAVEQSVDPQVEANAEVAEQLAAIRQQMKRLALNVGNRAGSGSDETRFGPDSASLFEFIERWVNDLKLDHDDLQSLITNDTSPWFDGWIRSLQGQVQRNVNPDPWAAASQSTTDPWASGGQSEEPPF